LEDASAGIFSSSIIGFSRMNPHEPLLNLDSYKDFYGNWASLIGDEQPSTPISDTPQRDESKDCH